MKLHLINGCLIGLLFASFANASEPIEGKWTSDCLKQEQSYYMNTMTIAGNNISQVGNSYEDSACKMKALEVGVESTAKYGPDSMQVAKAKELDTILSSLTLLVHDPRYISYLNSQKFCGYTDWAVEQVKDIAGKDCGGNLMPKVGDAYYDIYSLLNTDKLLTGKASKDFDGQTPEKRIRELDTDHPMSRVK